MKKYDFKSYSKNFPILFQREKERIESKINFPLIIEHIGSTAVPNLGGKGIIDIAIAVPQNEMIAIKGQLEALGYEFRPNFSTEDRFYFMIDLPDQIEETRRYHIHLTYPENSEWKEFLFVRDFLRTHLKEREEYAELKRNAAEVANNDSTIYRKLKQPFFQKIQNLRF